MASNQTQLINDGKAAAGLLLNRTFDTMFGPVVVDSRGERISDYAIFALDPDGNRQVTVYCRTLFGV